MTSETPSNSSSSSWKHDVFLSFRGEDTRHTFTGHLEKALVRKGIDTFKDDKKLESGRPISSALLKAIEDSRFAIVVLSQDFASSTWCLDELAKITERMKVVGLIAFPVFYHVEPTDVRKQTGDFGKAFAVAKNKQAEKEGKWAQALKEVANLSGWALGDKQDESELIEKIVKKIEKEWRLAFLLIDNNENLVGMDSRVKKMDLQLDNGLDDVRTIGIWGMGGIGKSTIAYEVYRRIYHKFDHRCFIANVREKFDGSGIIHLQNFLLESLFENEGNIQNVNLGTNILKKLLSSKKVLIILDDVDQLEQIEDLVGNYKNQCEWLGPGSRVIVTTRNKHLLYGFGEKYIYEVEKLSNAEALQLLCQKAFKENSLPDEFKIVCNIFIEYADGNPFALKLVGYCLSGRTNVEDWLAASAKLKENPKQEIFPLLQISYDRLHEYEQEIFLDIACFFKGEDQSRLEKIFDSCGFCPSLSIKELKEKSLLTMVENKLWMPYLLQKLGHYIVYQKFPDDPGQRSRLWFHKDAHNVFVNNKGTEYIQGIFFSWPDNKELDLNIDHRLTMTRLRLLKIHNVYFSKSFCYLSNELRFLECHRYPLISLPSTFQPDKLVELNLSNSRIERLWNKTPLSLEKLILINLTNCKYLKETLDFTRVPNLERLILEGCKRLSKVHPAIGVLKRLVLLNLKGCESLKSLPQEINMESLQTFILSGCTKLDKFPNIVGNMDHLSELYLDGTAIKELPLSIVRLTGLIFLDLKECKNFLSVPNVICSLTSLKTLDVSGCSYLDLFPENLQCLEQLEKLDASRTAIREAPSSILFLKNLKTLHFAECSGVPDISWKYLFTCWLPEEESISFQLPRSFFGLSSLTSLSLSKCNLREGEIPEDIGCLSSLQNLDLSGNNFISLPGSISQLTNLRNLHLDKCNKIQSLPRLPSSIKLVHAYDCPMLNDQMSIWASDQGFSFIDCRRSYEAENGLTDLDFAMSKEHIDLLLPKFIKDTIFHGGNLQICFPYTRIPEWCNKWAIGSSVEIKIPFQDGSSTWMGLALFVIFLVHEHDEFDEGWDLKDTSCQFSTNEGCVGGSLVMDCFKNFEVGSYGLCFYVPLTWFAEQLNRTSQIEASVSTDRANVEVKMCGMHVIYNHDVQKFSENLVKTSNEHLDFTSVEHYMYLLNKATKWERSPYVIRLPSYIRPKYLFRTTHPTSQQRKHVLQLLSELFEGSNARKNHFPFCFPIKEFPTNWFFHQSVGHMVVCYLPTNLFDDKSWVGFCLYAALKKPTSDVRKDDFDSEIPPKLHVDLHSHGSSISHIKTFHDLAIISNPHQLFLFHAPRVHFREGLNQCWGVSVLFRTSVQNVEVEMCGIQVVYEQDLGNVVEMITECKLMSSPDDEHGQQLNYQAYREELVEDDLGTVECGEPKTRKEEISIDSSYSFKRDLGSSAQPVDKQVSSAFEQRSVQRDPIAVHSIRKLSGSSNNSAERISSDSTFTLFHLQIMAETLLYENDLKNLECLLKHLFRLNNCICTLSLRGYIISVLKPFNPFSTYNLCFPRKEIMNWFADYQVSTRRGEMKLPAYLNSDNNWMGLAVCAAFSVQDHSNAIVDNESSEISFRLLCHLNTDQGYCLNPAPMFHITRDQFMRSDVGGFIWITYIPSCLLCTELNEHSYIELNIYNECPGVIVQNVGARLLYLQDVEEFRQSITECMILFFDNLNLSGRQNETSEDEKSYVVNPQKNLAEPTSSGKTGPVFDRDLIFNSCFPATDVLDWFSPHSSGSDPLQYIPTWNLYSDDNWTGLALCAYYTTTSPDHPHLEIPHNLSCNIKIKSSRFESPYRHQITNDDFKKLHDGEFIWLSYLPRIWFPDEYLNQCIVIEASFVSSRQGLWAQKCGLRLLYQHDDEEEFKQTINHCMVSFDKQYPIPQQERLEGRNNLDPKDKGKQIVVE